MPALENALRAADLFGITTIFVAQHLPGQQVKMAPAFALTYQGEVFITDKSETPMWSFDRHEAEQMLHDLVTEEASPARD